MANEQPTYQQPDSWPPAPAPHPASGPPGSGPPASGPPASGPPAWPDPYPSGPYASVQYPTGPYAAGSTVPVSGTTPLPVPIPGASADEPVIAQIGEIQVTATSVRTPVGTFPLRGSQWQVTDQWTSSQKIPTWAIVCAILGFFCLTLFSLFFLLAKETVYSGMVLISVRSGPYQYDTRMAVTSQNQVQHVHSLVNYARSLAAV